MYILDNLPYNVYNLIYMSISKVETRRCFEVFHKIKINFFLCHHDFY